MSKNYSEELISNIKKISERADMKQHADKLIQGFEKLDESHAKRAIWELFQNAIDLSDQAEIIIDIKEDNIIFSHNGKPFTPETLICLIKQVSSKKTNNNADEVGQYGTGFISTHSFGKKILVNGTLKVEDKYIVPIKNFEIDRSANDSEELTNKLIEQQERVFKLIKQIDQIDFKNEYKKYTSFTYITNSQLEKENAENVISSIKDILPYVMTFNKKIRSVKVCDKKGIETIYQNGECYCLKNNIYVKNIKINETIKKIYFLKDKDENIIVILPLSDENLYEDTLFENIPKLFLFYPLIGTENFGFNFLIHSKKFAPTEPRDGIHLNSQNEQVHIKEENNRILIEQASKMIFDFVRKHSTEIENPKSFATISFNTLVPNIHLSEYFTELKKKWVNEFRTIPLVETENEILPPEKIKFFSQELLLDDYYFDAIYAITILFFKNVPKKDIAKSWTEIIKQWEDNNISFLEPIDIVKEIEKKSKLDFFPKEKENDLQKFYEYLIKFDHGNIFNQHKILPNIKNEFRLLSQLNSPLNIDDALINIADVIIPDIPKRYIKSGFEFNLNFQPYDKKQFSKDINSKIEEFISNVKEDSFLPDNIRNSLVEYCKLFPSLKKTGERGNFIKLICEYYQLDSKFTEIRLPDNQEIDWRPAIKCLLRNLIWELNQQNTEWIKNHLEFIKRLLNVIHDYDPFKEIVQTLPIFPNQLFELCKQTELKIDDEIPEELNDLYDKVLQPSKGIRNILILSEFSEFLKYKEIVTPIKIGNEIESIFQKEKTYSEINDHPYKKEILDIIRKISDDNSWAKYFPIIEEKKAIILMASVSDASTKNDLFSIITQDIDKIKLLGELSRRGDLKEIIELGKKAVDEQKQNNANFQFKYSIGKHIEDLIREKIGFELENLKVSVHDEQNGQDIIIEFDGSIIYYVEVKSRWDTRNSITMSPTQMRTAINNKNKYALCCVEMSDYKIGKDERYNVTDINEIIDRIFLLCDIGSRVEPLNDILSPINSENEITLTGDFRGTIPQNIVKTGQSLNIFVDNLIKIINQQKNK